MLIKKKKHKNEVSKKALGISQYAVTKRFVVQKKKKKRKENAARSVSPPNKIKIKSKQAKNKRLGHIWLASVVSFFMVYVVLFTKRRGGKGVV